MAGAERGGDDDDDDDDALIPKGPFFDWEEQEVLVAKLRTRVK